MELFVADFWHWWIAAVLLLIIEILAPTFFALWLGIAALVTGSVVYFFPDLDWEYQVLLFSVLSLISIVLWHHYYKKNPISTDEPLLNRRGEQYINRVITLTEPIVDGQGKISIDDSTWKIEGEDCPAGTKVRITGVNNIVFQVEKVSKSP